MADQYLQQLTEETSPVDTDLIPITDNGTQRLGKMSMSVLRSFVLPSTPAAGSVIFISSGGIFAQDNSNLFWDDANKWLGIGTATPSAIIHAAKIDSFGTYTDASGSTPTVGVVSNMKMTGVLFTSPFQANLIDTNIDLTGNPGSAKIINSFSSFAVVPSTNSQVLSNLTARGVNFVATNRGSGTVGSLTGAGGFAINNSTGTVTTGVSVSAGIQNNNASGTITFAYGVSVTLVNSGTITTTYGVHVGDVSSGTQTNTPFSFYASDVNSFNYFAGNTGINETAPDAMLEVKSSATSEECIHVKAAASQTAHLQNWTDSSDNVLLSVSENGYLKIKKNAAPADAELDNNELSIWWDEVNSQLAFKAKNNSGTVKTGTVTLT